MAKRIIQIALIFGCICLTTACFPSFLSLSSEQSRSDDGELGDNPAGIFSVNNCLCAGISEKSNPANSSANIKVTPLNLRTGETVDIQRQLTCRWEEGYQSENLTSNINLSLQIFQLDSEEQAAAMYEAARIEIDGDRSSCLDDSELCTIETAQFKADRILYVEGLIYIRGDGEVLPSSHIGDLARIYEAYSNYYFIRATVKHPEKHLGDPWAMDQVLALDHCALSLIDE